MKHPFEGAFFFEKLGLLCQHELENDHQKLPILFAD